MTVEYYGDAVPAPVPFEPNAAAGIVTLGICFGGAKLYKRRRLNA